jgi:hypothetical protein
MVILTEDEDNKLNSGELFFKSAYDDEIITKKERDIIFERIIEEYNKYSDDSVTTIEEFMETDYFLDNQSEFPCDLDAWSDNEYLEYEQNTYTSPSGDNLVIHVKYGQNC